MQMPVASTGLTLEISGFDVKKRDVIDATGSIVLLTAGGRVAASWSFTTLLNIWTRKHAQAVFVPSLSRKGEVPQYRYGSSVHLGIAKQEVDKSGTRETMLKFVLPMLLTTALALFTAGWALKSNIDTDLKKLDDRMSQLIERNAQNQRLDNELRQLTRDVDQLKLKDAQK